MTVGDVKDILRLNNFETDEFAAKNPTNAVASRYDLHPEATHRRYYGAIDAKVTSSELMDLHVSIGVAGPTNSFNKLPQFEWKPTEWKHPYAVR
jgi:hypothetical protein